MVDFENLSRNIQSDKGYRLGKIDAYKSVVKFVRPKRCKPCKS